MAKPYSAAAAARSERKDMFKFKTQLKKQSDRSLLKLTFDSNSAKKAIVYEVKGEKWVDLVEENDENTGTKRAFFKYDTLFALMALLPKTLDKMKKGEIGEEHLLDDKTLLYLTTTRFVPTKKVFLKPTVRIYGHIRFKYEKEDHTLDFVSFFLF